MHHGTLRLELDGAVVWIDPWSEGDLSGPKADYVLITDIHPDHFDASALSKVVKEGTVVVAPPVVADQVPGAVVLRNGESRDLGKLGVEAIPMYNLERGPAPGKLFHDKGRGNGYLLTVGDKRIYISGDTECTDEMKALRNVDVAFVSMNLPYTMPPSEAAVCIQAFRPKVMYPYHFRGSNLGELEAALASQPGIELRIRRWY
ncbi:MBL fold metallo-hydrolase [Vulgatibacter incomptus]|uniref:MBL fold metallo-hydrolase n=1 Tax=Vulgatibacter incomptus TaxID=1391653 RepID=UPI00146FE744|nr:MBL fold metallo-hydrolase [Vulgatibacter incomptus]